MLSEEGLGAPVLGLAGQCCVDREQRWDMTVPKPLGGSQHASVCVAAREGHIFFHASAPRQALNVAVGMCDSLLPAQIMENDPSQLAVRSGRASEDHWTVQSSMGLSSSPAAPSCSQRILTKGLGKLPCGDHGVTSGRCTYLWRRVVLL